MFGLGLEKLLPEAIYTAGVLAVLLSLFWRPSVGLLYLIPLLPAQTLRYRILDFPLGGSVIGIVMLSVIVGLAVRGKLRPPGVGLTVVLAVYAVYTLISLFWGALYLGVSLPISPSDHRFGEWMDYMWMPWLLVLCMSAFQTRLEFWLALGLMAFAAFGMNFNLRDTLSHRDMSTYSEGLAEAGAMGMAGTNGLAAFEAQFGILLLVFFARVRNLALKLVLGGLIGLTVYCLMFSFSRGGYTAFIAGCLFLGVIRYRAWLLVAVVAGMFWTSWAPTAVRERIEMTTGSSTGGFDDSSETRLSLWSDALSMAAQHPIIGTGYYTYAYMNRMKAGAGHTYQDTHNYFVKVILETGIVGLGIFLFLFWRIHAAGFSLYRKAGDDELFACLGLGLAAWTVCSAVANLFGDRWTFLQVNAYMWILAGMACRAHQMMQDSPAIEAGAGDPADAGQLETAMTV